MTKKTKKTNTTPQNTKPTKRRVQHIRGGMKPVVTDGKHIEPMPMHKPKPKAPAPRKKTARQAKYRVSDVRDIPTNVIRRFSLPPLQPPNTTGNNTMLPLPPKVAEFLSSIRQANPVLGDLRGTTFTERDTYTQRFASHVIHELKVKMPSFD